MFFSLITYSQFMEKTTLRSLFLLTIITGSLFTFVACGPEAKEVDDKETTNVEDIENGKIEDIDGDEDEKGNGEDKDDDKDDDKDSDDKKVNTPVAPVVPVVPVTKPVETSTQPGVKVTTKYVDGTYTKVGMYQSPGGADKVTVTVVVKDDVVQSLSLVNGGSNEGSVYNQNLFIEGVNSLVVGKKLEDVKVGKVNGASLTGEGFNKAIGEIRTAAQK